MKNRAESAIPLAPFSRPSVDGKMTAPGFIPDLWCFDQPLKPNKIVYSLHFHLLFLGNFYYSRSFRALQAPFGKKPAISATLSGRFFPARLIISARKENGGKRVMIVPKNPHLNLSAIADSANASAGGGSPDDVLESFSICNLAAGIYDRMI
ncbi:MAG: hypothetical protein IJP78_08595 [Clostridia bacterium]|nr:hypothetical protein [Clostridia bacterium]